MESACKKMHRLHRPKCERKEGDSPAGRFRVKEEARGCDGFRRSTEIGKELGGG
jgi:hypothetical protein